MAINPQMILQSIFQNLFTRPPGAFGSLDPGSLYGAYKQDPKQTMMNTAMALSTGPTIKGEGAGYAIKPPPGSFPEGFQGEPMGLYNNIGNTLDTQSLGGNKILQSVAARLKR